MRIRNCMSETWSQNSTSSGRGKQHRLKVENPTLP